MEAKSWYSPGYNSCIHLSLQHTVISPCCNDLFQMKINDNGYIEYSVRTPRSPEVRNVITNRKSYPLVSISLIHEMSAYWVIFLTGDPMSEVDYFTDGLWHSVVVDVESGTPNQAGTISFTVDGRPDVSTRQLLFTTSEEYFIGGRIGVLLHLITM